MQIRLVALIPGLVLAGLAGAGIGLVTGVRFHEKAAEALPEGVVRYFNLQDSGLRGAATKVPAITAGTQATTTAAEEEVVLYQCGMHNPPYERGTPGKCPLCGMPLVEIHLHRKAGAGIEIDPAVVQNMGVRTAMPVLGKLQETVRAVGTLTEPEQNHREINMRVNGWVGKLYANTEGMPVNAGDPLFELVSPEISTAGDALILERRKMDLAVGILEKEKAATTRPGETGDFLLKAAQTGVDGALREVKLARRKLSLMGLSDEQVAEIEKMERAPLSITIVSPIHGHVAEKKVIEGSAVMAGAELMRIADRSTMWLMVQVFEQQLGSVKVGQKVLAKVEAVPGKVFEGKVDFVYPHLDPSTRTAQVRVVIENAEHTLHENMFAQAEIEVPEAERPGVLVPREAVMDSGARQAVFLAKGNGHFELRPVTVGRTGVLKEGDASRYVEVLTGLLETEAVVTSGQFLLDSESRLEEARRKFVTPAGGMPGMEMK